MIFHPVFFSCSGTGAANVRAVSSGYSNPPFQSAGLRETNAQIDDLKRKLKMVMTILTQKEKSAFCVLSLMILQNSSPILDQLCPT